MEGEEGLLRQRLEELQISQLNLWSAFVLLGVLGTFAVFGLHLAAEHTARNLPLDVASLGLVVPAVVLSAAIVPLTHGVLGHQRYGSVGWRFFQPLQGGIRFIILQALGWFFFGLSLVLPCLPWLAAYFFPGFVLRGLVVCAGASAVLSEIMIVTSLLTFKRPADGRELGEDPLAQKLRERYHGGVGLRKFLSSPAGQTWWGSFIGMQMALALLGCGLAVISELWATEFWGRSAVISSFALTCVAVSVCMTHGIGGRWRFFHDQWRFAGPPGGSWIFVLMQFFGWTFFALAIVIFVAQIFQARDAPSAVMGGVAGLISEVLLASSLLFFKRLHWTCGSPGAEDRQSTLAFPEVSLLRHAARKVLVVAMYNTQNFVFFAIVLSVASAPMLPRAQVLGWTVGFLLYPMSFLNAPHTRGTRLVKAFRGHWVFDEVASYFDLKIVRQSESPLKPTADGQRYIFGFHPHGIVPLTIGWGCLSSVWTKKFPGIHPAPLASSILHVMPLTRDLNQMFGGYAVTRIGFISALRQQGSAIFVPGGQYEMIHNSSKSNVVRINSRHRGFVKIALETGSDLVPVFSFGEKDILDNAPFPQRLQLMAMKHMRANIFFLPYGQFYMTIPRPASMRIAVGDPIKVPRVQDAPEEVIRQLHHRYFTALQDMVREMSARCEHPDAEIVVEPALPRVSAEEWAATCVALEASERRPEPVQELRHVSWTSELTWSSAFFVLMFALVLWRAAPQLGLAWAPAPVA